MDSSSNTKQIPSLTRNFGGFDMGSSESNFAVACEDDVIVGDDGLPDLKRMRFVKCPIPVTTKTLLGRKLSDPELQSELSSFAFNVTEDPNGFPLVQLLTTADTNALCTPTQLLTTSLSCLKDNKVSDCCIGVPAYFTYQERKEVLAAATMASLTPHRLLHETTAASLMYRFSEHYLAKPGEVLNMAFIDVGYTSTQVSFVELKKDQLKVLSHAHDKSLGGRAFDQVMFEHVSAELGVKTSQASLNSLYKLHLSNQQNSLFGLFWSCKRLKEKLSSNTRAELKYGNKRVVVSRAAFEKLSYALLIKFKELLQKGLNEARLATVCVAFVEVSGDGSRMPAITSIIKDFFKKEPRFALDQCDAIATGCFIQCAMLCLTTKLPKFQIIDILPCSIGLSWQLENDTVQEHLVVFPKGSPFPSVQDVTLYQSGFSYLDLISINDDDPHHGLSKISTYMIFASRDDRTMEMKIKVRIDLHGMAFIESAGVDGQNSFIELPYDERKTALRDKVQKVEDELANFSRQLKNYLSVETSKRIEVEEQLQKERSKQQKMEDSQAALERQFEELKIERENALKERDYALKKIEKFHQKKVREYSNRSVNCTEFSTSEIKKATNNFDDSLRIGEGGFGIVYKGFLRHTVVAIKILNPESYQGDIEFEFNQELKILTKVRHPNVISLIGASVEACALVYEFLPNGSLDDYLIRGKDSCKKLSWQDRIRIISEVCSALIFLHSLGKNGIAHGDLKPQNILLDSSLVSKIIDFGISRELQLTDKTKTPLHVTQYPKYTPAYADPEFFSSSRLTPQSDTYAFGIILLQLVTGRGPHMLIELVEGAVETGKLDDLVDVSTCEWPIEQGRELALLGLRCCDPRRRNRPDLKDVWSSIESMKPASGP